MDIIKKAICDFLTHQVASLSQFVYNYLNGHACRKARFTGFFVFICRQVMLAHFLHPVCPMNLKK